MSSLRRLGSRWEPPDGSPVNKGVSKIRRLSGQSERPVPSFPGDGPFLLARPTGVEPVTF
jgi:hypothetical protein